MERKGYLRVMTYNVHSCTGRDGVSCSYRIAQVIADFNPDVVALQELDDGLARTNHANQAKEIASHLDMDFHFHPCREVDEKRFGNAILTKLPLRLMKAGSLPIFNGWRSEKRGAIWATVLFGGREIQIINTHFGHLKKERMAQAEALLSDEWAKNPACKPPVIICGDLNTVPASRVYKRLNSTLVDAHASYCKPKRTYPSRRPLARIDHIFTAGGLKTLCVEVPRTELTALASDHLPLIVDLEVR